MSEETDNTSEEEIEVEEEIQSAWPILIGGLIVGLLLGIGATYYLMPTKTITETKTEVVKMPSNKLNNLIEEIDKEKKEELETYINSIEVNNSNLKTENNFLKNQERTSIVINPVIHVEKTREKLKELISNSHSITWITNSTTNSDVLKNIKDSIKVGTICSVLTSKHVIKNNVVPALVRGAIVHKCETSFSDNISLIILSQRQENNSTKQIILDVSNPDLLWVSEEPKIVKTFITWHQNLIDTGVESITK